MFFKKIIQKLSLLNTKLHLNFRAKIINTITAWNVMEHFNFQWCDNFVNYQTPCSWRKSIFGLREGSVPALLKKCHNSIKKSNTYAEYVCHRNTSLAAADSITSLFVCLSYPLTPLTENLCFLWRRGPTDTWIHFLFLPRE